MAKIDRGILGGFSGKVGTVIGYNWRGQEMMRAIPKKSKVPPTELQMMQRIKFGMAMAFLNPIRLFLERYYLRTKGLKSRFNEATGYTIQEAIVDQGNGVFAMDYPKVVISTGQLRSIENATVTALAGTKLNLTWMDNTGQGNAKATDVLIGMVYSEVLEHSYLFEGVAERGDGTYELQLPSEFDATEVHVWLSFAGTPEKTAALSTYVGMVMTL